MIQKLFHICLLEVSLPSAGAGLKCTLGKNYIKIRADNITFHKENKNFFMPKFILKENMFHSSDSHTNFIFLLFF